MSMAQTYPKHRPRKMVPLLTVDSSTFSASGSSCSHLHGGQKCIFRWFVDRYWKHWKCFEGFQMCQLSGAKGQHGTLGTAASSGVGKAAQQHQGEMRKCTIAALPDFNHGVPNTGASTTNTLTCNVRNVRIARSNSWSICRHVQSQRMAVWKQKSWSDPKPSTTLKHVMKHVKHVTLTFSTFKKHTQQITKCKHWPEIHVLIPTWLDSRLAALWVITPVAPGQRRQKACHQLSAETGDNFSRGSMSCFSCSSWGGGRTGQQMHKDSRSFQMQTEFPWIFAAGPKSQELTLRLKQL